MLFFNQLLALLWKNNRSIRPVTLLVLLGVPVLFHGVAQVINDAIQATFTIGGITGAYEVGLEDVARKNYRPLEVHLYYSPADDRTMKIMENLRIVEPKFKDVKGFEKPEDMVAKGLDYLERVNGRSDGDYHLFYVHFKNGTHFNVLKGKGLQKPETTTGPGWGPPPSAPSTGFFSSDFSATEHPVVFALQKAINFYEEGEPARPLPLRMETLYMWERDDSGGGAGSDYLAIIRELKGMTAVLIFNLGTSIGSLVFFFYPVLTIAEEKRQGLINLLRQMNLIESTYWIAMFIVYNAISVVSCIIRSIFLSLHPSVTSFGKFSFGTTFGVFFVSNMNTIAFSMVVGSLVRRPAVVNAMLGLVALGTIVGTAVLSVPHPASASDFTWTMPFVTYWVEFSKANSPGTFTALTLLLSFFPTGKYISNVIEQERIFNNQSNVYFKELIQTAQAREMSDIEGLPVAGAVIFLFLAWYFLQVLGDRDSMNQKSPLFFLSASFWGIKPQVPQAVVAGDTLAQLRLKSKQDNEFIVHKLSKSYGTGNTAVKEYSLDLKPGKRNIPDNMHLKTASRFLLCHPWSKRKWKNDLGQDAQLFRGSHSRKRLSLWLLYQGGHWSDQFADLVLLPG